MLILTRKNLQSVRISDGVTTIDIMLVWSKKGRARLGIDAPPGFNIQRLPEHEPDPDADVKVKP